VNKCECGGIIVVELDFFETKTLDVLGYVKQTSFRMPPKKTRKCIKCGSLHPAGGQSDG